MAKPFSGPCLNIKRQDRAKVFDFRRGRILRIASLYYEKKMRDELMDEFKDCSKILHTKPSSSFIADRHGSILMGENFKIGLIVEVRPRFLIINFSYSIGINDT